MKKKPATKAEKAHMDAVVTLGCIVRDTTGDGLSRDNACDGRITIHHVRRHGEKRKHTKVLGLCQNHHQDGGYGVAIEEGKQIWRDKYGTEEYLLEKTAALLFN